MAPNADPAQPKKSSKIGWTTSLPVFGSLFLGVLGNFLTDYVKDWIAYFSQNSAKIQLGYLQDKLDNINKAHQSLEYFTACLAEQFFTGSIAVVSLSITSTIFGLFALFSSKLVRIVTSKSISSWFLNYDSYINYMMQAAYICFSIALSMVAYQAYSSALNLARSVKDYDASVKYLTKQISDLSTTHK